jgi:hypothetical protein
MSIYKFKDGDIIRNVVRTYPLQKFVFYDSRQYMSHTFPSSSLELKSVIYKDSSLTTFSTLGSNEYNQLQYGDTISGSSYSVFSSSLELTSFISGIPQGYFNLCNNNKIYSTAYEFSGFPLVTKQIDISSIFYGSKIKKGSVDLKFYVTGTLTARLQDDKFNGELIQTYGNANLGSVAGLVFYKEGLVLLTGSWDITEQVLGLDMGKWTDFGYEDSDISSEIEFRGTVQTPVLNMFCHAPKGELNLSNNPTFAKHGQNKDAMTSSFEFIERTEIEIKNINDTNYLTPTGTFDKITYITTVNVYDDEKNLIGVAKLAKPIKKTEERDYTFKIKVDI